MSSPAENRTFDPLWEEKYRDGHAQRYPWDHIVSLVMRSRKRDRPNAETSLLEVGCGTGGNLWFAAREGFSVAGIDGSASAIEYARRRFAAEGLRGDLRVGDFGALPFADASFDLVFDRAALTCCGYSAAATAVAEIHRVLAPGRRFYFNPYSDRHSSRDSGIPGQDGLVLGIDSGTLVGAGQICFYSRQDVLRLLDRGWRIVQLDHLDLKRQGEAGSDRHCEWRVLAEKVSG